MNSRVSTDYLRGIAILIVVAVHYAGQHAQGHVPLSFDVLSSQAVFFFFVLSGYGLYFSLEKSYEARTSLKSWLASSFLRRALRIYPVFWLALLLAPVFLEWPNTWQPTLHNAGLWLGAPWVRTDSYFWFVSTIIQCYLVAPFLYLLLKRIGEWRFLASVFLLTVLLMLASFLDKQAGLWSPDFVSLAPFLFFGNLFLENIILFSMGLLLPFFISSFGSKLKKTLWAGLPLSAVALLVGFFLTTRDGILFDYSAVFYSFLTIVSMPLVCAYVIGAVPSRFLPFARAVAFLGAVSYSVYLFHAQFFAILQHLGLTTFGEVSWPGVALTLILLPLFIAFCFLIERAATRAYGMFNVLLTGAAGRFAKHPEITAAEE